MIFMMPIPIKKGILHITDTWIRQCIPPFFFLFPVAQDGPCYAPAMSEISMEITNLAYRGSGMGRVNGKVVFVPHTLPGECVLVRVVRSFKRYDEALLLAVERPSPSRCRPACPYAGQCPGCSYQHLTYPEELNAKDRQLQDFFRRLPHVSQATRMNPVAAPYPLHYRNKIVLHTVSTDKAHCLGYVGGDNRTIIPIRQCALALPEINAAMDRFIGESGNGCASFCGERITFRHTPIDGVLRWDALHPPGIPLTEQTVLGPLQIPATGFFQVNRPVADLLMRAVMAVIQRIQPDSMLDLFCGSGLFALAAAAVGVPQVSGIDSDRDAIRLAQHNALALGVPFVHFTAATAEQGLRSLPSSGGQKQLWLVDPPRQGLDTHTAEWMLKHHPGHVIYISCAPDTLARDLARLCVSAYRIEQVQLFDMFPRTYGFETLVLLSACNQP